MGEVSMLAGLQDIGLVVLAAGDIVMHMPPAAAQGVHADFPFPLFFLPRMVQGFGLIHVHLFFSLSRCFC